MSLYEEILHCSDEDCTAMLEFTETVDDFEREDIFMMAIWNLLGWVEIDGHFWYCPKHNKYLSSPSDP